VVLARLLLADLGPQDPTAPHWVAMGPASITVLAAAQIRRITGAPAVNAVRAVITGLAVIFRALASCLIPPLIARSTWRHLQRNAPLRYCSDLWMIVFPADMYATAGMQFGMAAALPLIQRIGTAAAWPATAAWALTFAAMIASPCTQPRARTGSRVVSQVISSYRFSPVAAGLGPPSGRARTEDNQRRHIMQVSPAGPGVVLKVKRYKFQALVTLDPPGNGGSAAMLPGQMRRMVVRGRASITKPTAARFSALWSQATARARRDSQPTTSS